MARYLIPLALFLTVVAFLAVGLYRDPRLVPSPLIGKPAPQFSLASLRTPARILTKADIVGRPVLLNIWATWCAACRAEHDFLMQLARDADIEIIGVNYKDDRASALSWLSQLGDPYVANIYDPEGLLALDLGVYGAPETFLLNSDGVIAYKHVGPLSVSRGNNACYPCSRSFEMTRAGLLFVLVFSLSCVQGLGAQETSFRTLPFQNTVQEQRYKSLINELRCLVCQNQSIADSDADLAQQLRAEVHAMILDGRADSEIVNFMVERYGDFVLFNPPLKLVTSLLWFGPFLFLVVGLGYLFVQIRKRARAGQPSTD